MKQRLDKWLVEHHLAPTRARAQAMIDAGAVWLDGQALTKASHSVEDDAAVSVKPEFFHPWVSRGGVKLDAALQHFQVDVKGAVALDIGASTGGFSEVLLHHGAAKIYAVDAGQGQLADRLRDDARVVAHEQVNARYLDASIIPEMVDLLVFDVSFISLTLVLPACMALAKTNAQLVALIKPQFEVGKEKLGKGGVVRDPAMHREVCERISGFISAQKGWRVKGLMDSPVQEEGGNREFLLYAQCDENH